ncbi:MAG: NAD-dependent epimerase/dehydratase family protein [Solirubrobacterales bacterium]|nr:NAD-dependent epimerase/dehydratase family protein [Solirubrobacterales bacterium]
MPDRVLVTGGAGFIGSQIVDQLVESGHEVRIVDCLHPAAHKVRPGYLNPGAEYIEADVSDAGIYETALEGVGSVCHQASMVGLGVDFGDARDYVKDNCLGTATLLTALSNKGFRGPLVLASSMVVYGEGRYVCAEHGGVRPAARRREDLEAGQFEPRCPQCGEQLSPELVGEDAVTDPRNVYAATKLHQEHLCGLFAREAEGVRTVALRYHNVYGPRMPRDTPYAGVASIFRSSVENGDAPRVFEDGGQIRDFVHVSDVARANVLALDPTSRAEGPFNIASGHPRTILDMAELLSKEAGTDAPTPRVTGEFRLGDVRHVFADPARAARDLGFRAEIGLEEGMREFATAELR